jgi:hypothetical protein
LLRTLFAARWKKSSCVLGSSAESSAVVTVFASQVDQGDFSRLLNQLFCSLLIVPTATLEENVF